MQATRCTVQRGIVRRTAVRARARIRLGRAEVYFGVGVRHLTSHRVQGFLTDRPDIPGRIGTSGFVFVYGDTSCHVLACHYTSLDACTPQYGTTIQPPACALA